ncbi:hypothetical protein HYY69_00440 [Candidatus Woesearchaeota archaeon]|nr:hypothetical protein [Candidatus Woesearchaeota archaeon]
MTESVHKQELLKQMHALKQAVQELKTTCNNLHQEKEKLYEEKQKVGNHIKELIGTLKQSKEKRDSFTQLVKDKKVKRDELHDAVKKKLDELKELEKQRGEVLKKKNITEHPSEIKRKIKALEYRIETSGMSFAKEQESMKQINSLKKRYQETAVASELNQKIATLEKEVRQLKQEANLSHHVVQSTAQESQKKHEELVGSSKEVEALRTKEKELYDAFSKLKHDFNEKNHELKEKLKQLNELYAQLDMDKEFKKHEKQKHDEATLEERRKQVDEKLKKGMKLTTKDIIAFQGNDDS